MLNYEDIINSETPILMGILNVTPDSFYDGGKYNTEAKILQRAEQMIEEGADVIDIGGYSTRPGAENISIEEELKRLTPCIEILLKNIPNVTISIDTFRADIVDFVAKNYNIQIINDISGGEIDKNMFGVISNLDICYILMHTKGTPQTMKNFAIYNNVTNEVFEYFESKIKELENLGIKKIIIDPGFGFAKTIEQNYELLRNFAKFTELKCPVLAGLSRKSMLYKTLGNTPSECLNATTVVNTMALMNGAKILRVHDVKAAREVIQIYQKYKGL